MMYLQYFMLGLEVSALMFCIVVTVETIISIIQGKYSSENDNKEEV